MKRIILTTVLMATSFAFADDPVPPMPAPVPSVEGTWNVTSRACTSNAPINDGVKLGQDSFTLTQNSDHTFEFKMTVAGCETAITGTYILDGMKATYTSLASKGCKDTTPVPMIDTYTSYFAYLGATEAVAVTTGDKAAMSCPAGDALIVNYSRQISQPF